MDDDDEDDSGEEKSLAFSCPICEGHKQSIKIQTANTPQVQKQQNLDGSTETPVSVSQKK